MHDNVRETSANKNQVHSEDMPTMPDTTMNRPAELGAVDSRGRSAMTSPRL